MTAEAPAVATRVEKHCGYCKKWRDASTFSTQLRIRNGLSFKVPICALCKEARKVRKSAAERDAFGREASAEHAAEQSRRTAILNEKKKTPPRTP